MSTLGVVHTVCATLALLLGGVVVTRRKGDRMHRTVGHLYVSCMLGLNLTSFGIYGLFGRFGPFHVAAIVSLATLIAGLLPVLLRAPRDGWFQLHAVFMSWSYVGLLAAAASEVIARVPGLPFGGGVLTATMLVTIGGAIVIHGGGGSRITRALRRAGVLVPLGLLLVTGSPGRAAAQHTVHLDALRQRLERAVLEGDAEEIARVRAELAGLAAADPANGLVVHYVGYGAYRAAAHASGEHRDALLDSARAALERSATLLALAETHALLATVIGQQIGDSMWRGMRLGSRLDRELERAAALDADNPRVLLLQATRAFHAPRAFGGDRAAAEQLLLRALAGFLTESPPPPLPDWGHAEAWAWLGRVRAARGDVAGARTAYQEALLLFPDYAWVTRVLLPRLQP